MRIGTVIALVLFAGTAGFGQAALPGLTVVRPPSLEPAVKNAPYSAELDRVVVYPSRGGVAGRETHETTKIFRDSQGRVRTEGIIAAGNPGASHLLIMLSDASAGRQCYLNADDKVAHCFSSIPVQASQIPSDLVVEDLGTRTIEGVRVEGKRYTYSSLVTERWTSPELQIDVQSHMNNIGSIQNTMTNTNIRREEPEASLFAVPPDYRMVNETGDRAGVFGAPTPSVPAGVYRPGNGVSQPQLTKRVQPKYTQEARRNKIEGTVTLTIIVAEDGTPTSVKVLKSLDPGLDQQAIEAVRQWRFQPGQKDGKPVAVMANVEVNFRFGQPPAVP